eukprot:6139743-Pyramimonas_sp.AAC.1
MGDPESAEKWQKELDIRLQRQSDEAKTMVPLEHQVNRAFNEMRALEAKLGKSLTTFERLEGELDQQRDRVRTLRSELQVAEEKHKSLASQLQSSAGCRPEPKPGPQLSIDDLPSGKTLPICLDSLLAAEEEY